MSDERTTSRETPEVWGVLELELDRDRVEPLLARLSRDCIGAEVRPTSGENRERLTVYFADPGSSAAAHDAAREFLRAEGVAVDASGLAHTTLEDGHWVERYQQSLIPFAIGERFVVDPRGDVSAAADATDCIRLVPGRAFGTGEHATTRLCVTALERRVRPGSVWLDLGCGSGILAVVAARCGAAHVLAVDVDPQAVRVAREVVTRNGVGESVRVEQGSLPASSPGSWDGVVANISTVFLTGQAGHLSAALRDEGVLVASGFPVADRGRVLAAFRPPDWCGADERSLEGWGAIVRTRSSRGR